MSDPRFVAIPLGQSQRFRGAVEKDMPTRPPATAWVYLYRCPHAHRKPESAIACAREWFLREGK